MLAVPGRIIWTQAGVMFVYYPIWSIQSIEDGCPSYQGAFFIARGLRIGVLLSRTSDAILSVNESFYWIGFHGIFRFNLLTITARLQVVQQPKRARMCGFGDKDRRPITPPPCIRLIITEEHTGHEVDTNHILYGMFILNVDLWNKEGTSEVNLVRHNTMSGGHSSDGPPVSYTETMHVLRPGHLQQAPPPADWSRKLFL